MRELFPVLTLLSGCKHKRSNLNKEVYMRIPKRRVLLGWIFMGLFIIVLGIFPVSFSSDGKLWAQSQEEEEDLDTKVLSVAKRTLQNMGMELGDKIGRVGNVRDMKFAYAAKISDSQKALSKGFGLAEPRPTPVKSGTGLSVVIDAKGKVTFFVDSQNKLKNSQNQSTSIAIDKAVIPSGVAVSSSSFPSVIK
jgi:hypothetical protein